MLRTINLIIDESQNGKRFDQAASALLPNLSRSRIQSWIKSGTLTLNNLQCAPKHKVYLNDIVAGTIEEHDETDDLPQDLPINVIHEDNSVLVINKPAGFVVHPGAGNKDGTLLNALLYHYPESKHIPRAGIVHRLDKDTSGIMVVAKTLEAQFNLVKQLQKRTVKRHYVALAVGELTGGGTINANIGRSGNDRLRMSVTPGGKEGITHYTILERYHGLTLLKCSLETGRTHQIRVHLSHNRHPIVGDPLYGGRNRIPKGLDSETRDHILSFPRQALHAKNLGFIHPDSDKMVSFKCHLPEDFENLLEPLAVLQNEYSSPMDWLTEWADEFPDMD